MDLGKRIKKRREELNISQEVLAKKMGYKSRSSINKIELGLNDIYQSKIAGFAKALETTPAYLMGWDESPTPQTALSIFPPTQQKIISNCQQLNETGQKKVLDFSDDLVSSNNYSAAAREPGFRIAAYGAAETEEDIQPPIEETTT